MKKNGKKTEKILDIRRKKGEKKVKIRKNGEKWHTIEKRESSGSGHGARVSKRNGENNEKTEEK